MGLYSQRNTRTVGGEGLSAETFKRENALQQITEASSSPVGGQPSDSYVSGVLESAAVLNNRLRIWQ
jgi:hypothetical protein